MRAENRHCARRNFGQVLHKARSLGFETLDHVPVVDYLVAHIDRRAEFFECALHNLDGPDYTGTETPRLRQNNLHEPNRCQSLSPGLLPPTTDAKSDVGHPAIRIAKVGVGHVVDGCHHVPSLGQHESDRARFTKTAAAPKIGVVPVMNRATKGPFYEQPLCKKEIPGETSVELAGVSLGVDRTPDMQARPQEVIQKTILIFSADWSIQKLKIDVGGSLLIRFWTVDPEKGAGAEFNKCWVCSNQRVVAGHTRGEGGQAARSGQRRGIHCRRRYASATENHNSAAQARRPRLHGSYFIEEFDPRISFGGCGPQSQMGSPQSLKPLL